MLGCLSVTTCSYCRCSLPYPAFVVQPSLTSLLGSGIPRGADILFLDPSLPSPQHDTVRLALNASNVSPDKAQQEAGLSGQPLEHLQLPLHLPRHPRSSVQGRLGVAAEAVGGATRQHLPPGGRTADHECRTVFRPPYRTNRGRNGGEGEICLSYFGVEKSY